MRESFDDIKEVIRSRTSKQTNNIMTKGEVTKDRQNHGQTETDKRQTISWTKGNLQKTDNIMAKGKLKKDRKYHGQRETDKRTNCDI